MVPAIAINPVKAIAKVVQRSENDSKEEPKAETPPVSADALAYLRETLAAATAELPDSGIVKPAGPLAVRASIRNREPLRVSGGRTYAGKVEFPVTDDRQV